MWKHRIKMGLRRGVADVGYASGAWRLAKALDRKGRITILTLHCVGFPEGTDHLPAYMKLAEDDFDRLLARLKRSFEMISLHAALERLAAGEAGPNAVVITMDDGYLDNRTHALPILERHGVTATIFLEAGAVDRRQLSWIQKHFFIDKLKGSAFFAREYAGRTRNGELAAKLAEAAAGAGNMEYAVKRVLKYEADPAERDRVTDEIYLDLGGDAEKTLDGAYLSWDDVKAMAARGITFGCHTVSHPILSTLTKEEARKEIIESKKLIEDRGGVKVNTFAYPWGRSWDFNAETVEVLKEEGFICGLAMDETSAIPGRNDPYRLSRYPLAEGFRTADIFAEASGLYAKTRL